MTPQSTIFRPEALAYRLRTRGRRAASLRFPRLMARPVTIAIWAVLALCLGGGAAAFLPAVPVSATGLAIVTTETAADGASPVVAVLMQAEYHERLQPGHDALVLLGPDPNGLPGTIVSVEPMPLPPAAVGERLGLPAPALAMIQGDVSVVWVSLDGATAADLGIDSFGRADLDVGTRRAGAFLPLVGRFFEE